mgnify:CR=1 FL=1
MKEINVVFKRRITEDLKLQLRVFRTVIDWTIALYILTPLLLIGLYHYYTWWQGVPSWVLPIPFELALGLLFLFSWLGRVRLFFQEADRLFLIHDDKWSQGLIKRGIAYSLLFHFFSTLVFFSLIAPFFLLHYQVSLLSFALLGFFVFLMKGILALGKQLIEVISTNTWERISFLLVMFAGGGILFSFMIVLYYHGILVFIFGLAIPIGIIILLFWARLQLRGSFFADVVHERKERTRYIRLFLGMSMSLDHQPIQLRNKHFIFFRQSNHLFRNRRVETVLVELGIKTFLRDRNQLFSYLRIMGVSIFAILQVPLTLKWFLWPLIGLYLAYWCKNFWKDIESSSFLHLFYISKEDLLKARHKVIQWLTFPGFFVISILIGLVTYQWIGVLLMLPISYSLSYLLGRIIGVFD